MNNSLFNFRDDEEREMFLVAIPVIALFAILGYWLMKGEPPEVQTQTVAAVASDTDNDGVSDNADQCINLAGTVANYGCPAKTAWAEKDNDLDGIRNGIDSCPETKGVADNNGCAAAAVAAAEPVAPSDKDNDGFIDNEDSCPDQAGENGSDCPADRDSDGADTDNDGINDIDDRCPTLAGTGAANGCPSDADGDADGVPDDTDQCPSDAGLAINNGCPADADYDGISDADDRCPQQEGVADNQGCPADADGDGISDANDQCPNEAGTEQTNGCPAVSAAADGDGDGIPDSDDNCPSIKGVNTNFGCPNDTDGDGIADADDKCPAIAGVVESLGCPASTAPDTAEVKRILDAAISGVKFNSSSAVLTARSREVLRTVADLMNQYPDTILEIRGHTDSSGNPAKNMQLSMERARSCAAFIAAQGVNNDRLRAYGLGDTEPLEDNSSIIGRERNRRVEFVLK